MHSITENYLLFYSQEVQQTEDACKLNVKKSPRRVIHFSDGTIEEYSSDEDEVDKSVAYTTEVNPVSISDDSSLLKYAKIGKCIHKLLFSDHNDLGTMVVV